MNDPCTADGRVAGPDTGSFTSWVPLCAIGTADTGGTERRPVDRDLHCAELRAQRRRWRRSGGRRRAATTWRVCVGDGLRRRVKNRVDAARCLFPSLLPHQKPSSRRTRPGHENRRRRAHGTHGTGAAPAIADCGRDLAALTRDHGRGIRLALVPNAHVRSCYERGRERVLDALKPAAAVDREGRHRRDRRRRPLVRTSRASLGFRREPPTRWSRSPVRQAHLQLVRDPSVGTVER